MADTENGIIELNDAMITNGNFEFTGRMPEATAVYLMSDKKDVLLATFFLENALYTITAGPTGLIVEGGGEAQKVWKEFDVLNNHLIQSQQTLGAQARTATSAAQVQMLQQKLLEVQNTVIEKENKLIARYSGSPVAAYAVAVKIPGMEYEQLSGRYELLGADAKATFYGKRVAAAVEKLAGLAIGAVAPDFTLPLADGGVISLHEAKAKVKVVDFWQAANPTCRQQNLNMLQIYKRFHPRGLEIIAVSLDNNKQTWLKAVGEDGSTWKNVSDLKGPASETVTMYSVTNLPCNFIIDEENRIVAKNLYGKALEQKIAEMLKKKK